MEFTCFQGFPEPSFQDGEYGFDLVSLMESENHGSGISPKDNSTNLIYQFADIILSSSSIMGIIGSKETPYLSFCDQMFTSENGGFLQSPFIYYSFCIAII